MIDLKEATEIAKKFILGIDQLQNDIHLESVFLSSNEKSWEVVFSYSKQLESQNDLQKLLGIKSRKFYKKVIVGNDRQIIGYDNAYDKSEMA